MAYIVATMFVQATKSRRKDKTYITYLVRESYRTPQGPRARTICNITGLPENIRLMIAGSLKGGTFEDVSGIELANALDYGGLAVLKDAWERFGMDGVFLGIDARKKSLLQAMIFGRLLFPCSKLGLEDQARGTMLASACGLDQEKERFDEDELYYAMDELNGRWVGMEKALYSRAFKDGASLVLYDLTSVYFEGKGPKHMGRFGHSRDHRSDRRQVIVAVATDSEGVPMHIEVLRGNRNDNSTLRGLLANLRRRFGITDATFVFDGGMSSRMNLAAMDDAELKYVTRLSSASLSAVLKALPEEKQPDLWDRTKVLEIEHEGKRYVIAGGQWRKEKDAARRSTRISMAEKELERIAAVKRSKTDVQSLASQVGRALERLKASKYIEWKIDDKGALSWSLRSDLISDEGNIDGWYLLHTNIVADKADGKSVLKHYKNLIDVEHAFRELKTYMELRPVFHYRPDRVRNHIRICFLAYWMNSRLAREWNLLDETGEVSIILRKLQSIRIGHLLIKSKSIGRKITKIPKDINELLKKLNLTKLFATIPNWRL